MDGILRCSRYAFGPNRLHYCGPDANRELLAYIGEGEADFGLRAMLSAFKTLAPYLRLIAQANGIADMFDDRVVEAYWLGNELLDGVDRQRFYRHLEDGLGLRRKLGTGFSSVSDRIGLGAVPHHSFHVLSVWRRTGQADIFHTLDSLDSCRIAPGEVLSVHGPKVTVEVEPLATDGRSVWLGSSELRTVLRPFESREDMDELSAGQIVALHWGVPCEVITPEQADRLRRYTARHLALAVLPQ
ncbi:hypothetical protein COY93_01595 [Candidatus Uhrbacteria bacterium CG_4_10_14_0_8_um_filter_58_22]|uniref:Uncharacterized protein n=1 Tax=Candidatus Uhrbacteria bacterium CG_4_10_14_0_8_um_filter_58_22 TaxID=1975029 RepID=A0A2M7QBF4_9BACT|nr:MAG: hypothetical protein COY93_01595 [Candidatus Uhrbacteria bacterium CG_4_10_14_0_8_um_filter_58_22]